jgi:hypothetical protein
MNFLPEKKYGVPSHNFVKKNVLWEKGDEITRFDGSALMGRRVWRGNYKYIHQCSQFPVFSVPIFHPRTSSFLLPDPGNVFFRFLLCSVSREY